MIFFVPFAQAYIK